MAQPMMTESSKRAPRILPDTQSDVSADDEELEKRHYEEVVAAFRHYRAFMHMRLNHKLKDFDDLPGHHQALLQGFRDHLGDVRHCVDHNYEIIKLIIENTDCMFVNRDDYSDDTDTKDDTKDKRRLKVNNGVAKLDMEKVLTTIKQFVRDWSKDGISERQACYGPIIEEIQTRLPLKDSKESITVLVPGAGLGRLAFEVAKLGYSCQGNEFSLYMLFASHFILNRSPKVEGITIYPWAHQFSNIKSNANQTRQVTIPDISPSSLQEGADFSMVAGDFLEVYDTPAQWDCVATCFFIDTAHNILDYIEKIYKILKPGGIWINLGPLLYHFENTPKESSIEIAYDVLRQVILDFSFVILREESIHASYLQDHESMLKYEYDCIFFVCQKPLHSSETTQEIAKVSEKQ
ncbi:carnosine N-methyltransferase-like [Patiria miniata]|uniref:Carnosine N-methyltransferase n=1 Tax=Patiria miniata TaxID=46514 RepID=A0A914A2R5_PATMI|nr:carnosine N-methyltransferase-like [Patiria miniata]